MSVGKFKVGDRVNVKSGISQGVIYGGWLFDSDMKRLFNYGCCTVVDIYEGHLPSCYILRNSCGIEERYFTDEMLELCTDDQDIEVNDESISEFLDGWLKDVNRKI